MMKITHILLILFLTLSFTLFSTSIHALTIDVVDGSLCPPNVCVLTGCDYVLTEQVVYDVCLTPVEDATVYYNITLGAVDNPSTLYYPLGQTLNNDGNGFYSRRLEAPWVPGLYTDSVKVERVDYETKYDSATMDVLPDYPFSTTFFYSGDLNYLNSFWTAEYQSRSCYPDRLLAVECYLNDDYANPCLPYPAKVSPGEGTCSVPGPAYDYGNSHTGRDNDLSCMFYDPEHPWLLSWTNRTFKPIAFDAFVSPVATTIGKTFNLPVQVKNLGLLTDNYTVDVVPNRPDLVWVDPSTNSITKVETNQTGVTYFRLIILTTSVPLQLSVTVTSDISGISYTLPPILIKTGMSSLPDFGLLGIIQIIVISSIVFAIVKFKIK